MISGIKYTTVRKRVSSLKPSPENATLYRNMHDDPDIGKLAESIKRNGCDPLTVTADNYIVSGHRRHAALRCNEQAFVQCQVLPFRRDYWTTDEYLKLLREHNHQRNKTVAEQVREELIDIDPNEAHARLREQREKPLFAPERNCIEAIEIEGRKRRYNISEDKAEHVRLIKEIVFVHRKDYWPLSVRGVHYPLLNYDFVRGFYWPRRNDPNRGTKRELRYANDEGSYSSTSDLITRLRLNREIPWEAFDDPTRPLREFHSFRDARQFVRQETSQLFAGYWRNLLQTQPNHIEVVCEKNTVYHMVLRVTSKYQIPTSSGRGFNSIDPWHDLHERFSASGKQRLVVIVLSDFDPEGEMIPIVGGRTLRDDFGVSALQIIKAGVTREQINDYSLPPMNFAKETSPNFNWFCNRNDGDSNVYELEALEPEVMLDDLNKVIQGVIDVDLFNREVEKEANEAAYLEACRKTAMEAMKDIAD
jgi:hypothetical protein